MVGEAFVSLAVELRADDCCPIVDSPVALAGVVVPALVVSSIVAVSGAVVVLLWVNDCCPIVDSPVVLADVVVPTLVVPSIVAVVDAVVVLL